MKAQQTSRRRRAYLGSLHLNMIHYTNPWVTATWSWFMPGFGHLLLGQYLLGWILFVWEVVINVESHFNVAILYAFTGRFRDATQILQHERVDYWILTYGAVFVFTVYHSYKVAIDTNEIYGLANHENSPPAAFSINQIEWNYLNKQNPVVGALWSLLLPGIGAVYTHLVLTAIFEITWWSVIVIKLHVLPSVEYTAIGNFGKAISVLNPEWALFIPSMLAFPFYYTYVITVERNKLFDKEQADYFVQNYQQNKQFPLQFGGDSRKMRFIASFSHSLYLEKAVAALESIGVFREDIFVAPLDKRNQDSIWFDTIERSDGKSLFDGVSLLAALGCFFGSVYGFVLHWGPVIWGLIGFASGCLLGALIKLLRILLRANRPERVPKTEVVLIVDCEDDLARKTEEVLWKNYAFGLSKVRG